MKKVTISLLASGNLGYISLEHLFHKKNIELHSVFSDRKSNEIITFCKKNNIPCFVGNPRRGATTSFRDSLTKRPDIILSINYLFLIENDMIKYPYKYAINVHGSLLPKYRGRTPHVWAIINNEKQTGISAHLITNECDKGDIIVQKKIPIKQTDTGGAILKKYNKIYPHIINDIIKKVQSGSLTKKRQNESKATYFPKRVPEDGEINWNWHRERIYNWIRAMAPPEYPGAFFYDRNVKIIAEKSEFSDIGFPMECKNGTIILRKGKTYYVKTPNGCLKVTEYSSK